MKSLFIYLTCLFPLLNSAQATYTLTYNSSTALSCGVGDTLKLYGTVQGLYYEASLMSGTISASVINPVAASLPALYIGSFVITGNETNLFFTEHSNNGTINVLLDVFQTTGISKNSAPSKPEVYPNPANSFLTVSSSVKKEFEILSAEGKPMMKIRVEGENVTKDISDFPAGIYFLRDDKKTIRIIKNP